MKVSIIGYGNVGSALAGSLAKAGYGVSVAKTSSANLAGLEFPDGVSVKDATASIQTADLVFLSVPFGAVEAVLADYRSELSGKIIVDCTNPVGPGLSHGLVTQGGSEFIQSHAPDSHVVKAFTIYGFENLRDNRFSEAGVLPVMMYAGDDANAKARAATVIADLGWEPLDVGGLDQALHLEHLTLLWIKMIRTTDGNPHTVWAKLTK